MSGRTWGQQRYSAFTEPLTVRIMGPAPHAPNRLLCLQDGEYGVWWLQSKSRGPRLGKRAASQSSRRWKSPKCGGMESGPALDKVEIGAAGKKDRQRSCCAPQAWTHMRTWAQASPVSTCVPSGVTTVGTNIGHTHLG